MIRVPEIMKPYKQWGTWRYENGDQKIPYMPGFKRKLRTNDPKTFSHYESICNEERICFVIRSDDTFVGIDIDDCIIDGNLSESARSVVDLFSGRGWIEISPSGTGLKITTQGTKPTDRCVFKIGSQKFEVYDHGRYWTMTGNIFEGNETIAEANEQIDQLFEMFDKEEVVKTPPPPIPMTAYRPPVNDMRIDRARMYLLTVPLPRKGERNNVLFKTAGHIWKIVDGAGQSLDEETIFRLMWDWCGGYDPEIDQDFLRKRVINAKTCGKPPAPKPPEERQQVDTSLIDQWLAEQAHQSDETDEEYLQSLVPASGLIKEIFDFYNLTAHLFSPTIGMATAISFLEALFGRRLQSDSGLRTNDYNVVLADSGVGKEMAEKTIIRILSAVGDLDMVCPAGVQSGNGLLAYLASNPCSLWIKDEFGMYLEGVFGKKKQPIEMQVGRLLLELYGKSDSRYSGNAHAAGKKHEIDQPHLCLLGLSTFGTLFANIDYKEVESGLFSRIAWWPVTERTQLREDVVIQPIPESIVEKVKKWLEFRPEGGFPPLCQPVVLPWAPEAKDRWKMHQRAIRAKQETETTGRAAIWSRVAARTIKLSLIHRGARLYGPEEINQWSSAALEMEDIDWAIKISNWIARTACNLALNNTSDMNSPKAQNAIMEFIKRANGEPVKLVTIQRNRSMQKNEIMAAALVLEREGKIEITRKPYGTKELVTFRGLTK